MTAYFFDSSAMVKRFAREKGTVFVLNILRPSSSNSIYVSRLTEVEVFATLARKRKGHILTPNQVDKAVKRLRRDFIGRFAVISSNENIFLAALNLADVHALRGYDAIQLASALEANRQRLQRNLLPLVLVSADDELNTAAQTEGLIIKNPNNYI